MTPNKPRHCIPDDDYYLDAIRAVTKAGMTEAEILGATMRHLKGKANPTHVLSLIRKSVRP